MSEGSAGPSPEQTPETGQRVGSSHGTSDVSPDRTRYGSNKHHATCAWHHGLMPFLLCKLVMLSGDWVCAGARMLQLLDTGQPGDAAKPEQPGSDAKDAPPPTQEPSSPAASQPQPASLPNGSGQHPPDTRPSSLSEPKVASLSQQAVPCWQ